jgi:alkylhydroperoxidase family enzyme
MDIGSAVGREVGVTEAQLLDLPHYKQSLAFSAFEKLVIEYAEQMTKTPVEIPDELFAALRQHFNEAQMVELTAAIAWENYRARFDHAFGIEAQGFSKGAFCVLPERVSGNASLSC